MNTIPPDHRINDVPYATWVWNMIWNLDEAKLAQFGPYSEHIPDEFISPKLKIFMFLDSMMQSERDRELFANTSSTLVAERLDEVLHEYHLCDDSDHQIDELYNKLVYVLYDYLEGC